MPEFSKVSRTVWDSAKFEPLSRDDKLLYLYILSNKSVNSCGCYTLKIGHVMADLGYTEEEVRKGIDRVSKAYLIAYNEAEKLVIIEKWMDHNPPANPKHANKIFQDILSIGYLDFQSIALFNFVNVLEEKGWELSDNLKPLLAKRIDSLSKAYPKSITTLTLTIHKPITITNTKTPELSLDFPLEKPDKKPKVKKFDMSDWQERELEQFRLNDWEFDPLGRKEDGMTLRVPITPETKRVFLPYGDFRFKVGMSVSDLPENYEPKNDPSNSKFDPYQYEGNIIKLRQSDFKKWENLYPGNSDQFWDFLVNRNEWLANEPPERSSSWFVATEKYIRKIAAGGEK